MSETHETEAYESEAREGAEQEEQEVAGQGPPLLDLIREHPWISVLGAAALGFVVARLVRRDR